MATAVAVDAQGSIWVAGNTASVDYPVVGEPFREETDSGVNLFVAKLDQLLHSFRPLASFACHDSLSLSQVSSN